MCVSPETVHCIKKYIMPAKAFNIPEHLAAISQGRDFLKTSEFGHIIRLSNSGVRWNYKRTGSVCGVKPVQMGTRLLWPVSQIAEMLNKGGV